MNIITIIAIDLNSSDTMSRTFGTTHVEGFKKAIEEFEGELPYKNYELMCDDFMDDYTPAIIAILDELDVTY